MLPFTLLHGGMVDENATVVQQFIDSEPGNNVGTFMHTIGAAFFIGAALVLMLWAWNNRRGFVDPARYHVVATQWILLAGMGMNGAGGLIRLLQSDHPGLEDLGANPWVDYIFYKHIGLVAANVLALALLVWYVPKRHRVLWWPPAGLFRRKEPPEPDGGEPEPNNPRSAMIAAGVAAFIVVASLLAGVLGAAATTVGPGTEEDAEVGTFTVAETPSAPRIEWINETGSIQAATPVQPHQTNFPFSIGEGVVRVVGTIQITSAGSTAQVQLSLLDPNGGQAATASATPSQPTGVASVEAPVAGGWTAQVRSTAGANTQYALSLQLHLPTNPRTEVSGTAVIPPGAFAQLNFDMAEGDSFRFAWETDPDQGSPDLDFDVRWDDNGTLRHEHAMTTCCVESPMTYNASAAALHSPRWTNDGPTPILVGFVITGTFKFHSAAGF